MKIEISNGEILDKFSILEIKKREIKDINKLKNVENEYNILNEYVKQILDGNHPLYKKLLDLYKSLLDINMKLWKIEDDIRICERNQDFGPKFIELARAVYFTNDERAEIKKEINFLTNSNIVEEKSYEHLK